MIPGAPAKRLVFTGPEFALLCDRTGLAPPPGHRHGELPDDVTSCQRGLVERGVFTDAAPPRPHVAVTANLALFAAAQVLIRVEVDAPEGQLAASYAIADEAGGSLFELPELGAELSLFPAVALGRELIRAVPAVPEPDGPPGALEALACRVPLALVAEPWDAFGVEVGTPGLAGTPEQQEAARAVNQAGAGRLVATVSGPLTRGRSSDPDESTEVDIGIGRMVWLRTRHGYLSVEADSSDDDATLVTIRPAHREDLGLWVAPTVAALLDAQAAQDRGPQSGDAA